MLRSPTRLLLVPFVLLLAVAACGSDSEPTSAGSSGTAGAGGLAAAAGAAGTTGGSGTAGSGAVAGTSVTASAVTAAQAFLASLDENQRTKVSFAFSDDAQRTHWSNLPTGLFQRNGLSFGAMSQVQQDGVFALLRAVLSAKGYAQVVDVVNADEALRQATSGGNLVFGKAEYYVSLLGTPDAASPWMIQFGGHHLAINVTIVGEQLTLAPSLTGAQPASYVLDGVTVRPQGLELDAAAALMGALDETQKQKAIINASFIDLVLGPGQDGKVLSPEGIAGAELTDAQQALLMTLVAERVGLLDDVDADARLAEIRASLAETYFAWAGPSSGGAAYFRVTGPTLAIEYSPQSLGGDASDHTHAMFRHPTNDYGKAWLP